MTNANNKSPLVKVTVSRKWGRGYFTLMAGSSVVEEAVSEEYARHWIDQQGKAGKRISDKSVMRPA